MSSFIHKLSLCRGSMNGTLKVIHGTEEYGMKLFNYNLIKKFFFENIFIKIYL